MNLETVRIKRFRSIEEVSLEDVGQLNVLIGKNNSGKSNILLSIDSFFACIKGGNIVTSEAPIGADIDHFEKRTKDPTEIELSFSMDAQEREELVSDIVNVAPQMKNATDEITSAFRIVASIRTMRPPGRAFVSDLSLKNSHKTGEKGIKVLTIPKE